MQLIIIILLVVVFCGGGYGYNAGYFPGSIGLLPLLLIIAILVLLFR